MAEPNPKSGVASQVKIIPAPVVQSALVTELYAPVIPPQDGLAGIRSVYDPLSSRTSKQLDCFQAFSLVRPILRLRTLPLFVPPQELSSELPLLHMGDPAGSPTVTE